MSPDIERKPAHLFPVVSLSWDRSSAPEIPVSLPIRVEVRVEEDSIRIHAKREGSIAGDEEADIHFPKDDILGVDIVLRHDIPDDTDLGWTHDSDLSTVIISHRDPFEVVPCFKSTFTSAKSYWPKALAKALHEKLGIDTVLREETKRTK